MRGRSHVDIDDVVRVVQSESGNREIIVKLLACEIIVKLSEDENVTHIGFVEFQ